jgi:hypothetical protein
MLKWKAIRRRRREDVEGSGHGLIEVLSQNFHGGTEEKHT